MEMPIDQEDFDNEIFESLTSTKSQDEKRYCVGESELSQFC
jgi:hypothetical protein